MLASKSFLLLTVAIASVFAAATPKTVVEIKQSGEIARYQNVKSVSDISLNDSSKYYIESAGASPEACCTLSICGRPFISICIEGQDPQTQLSSHSNTTN